jgi:hypothetical protein
MGAINMVDLCRDGHLLRGVRRAVSDSGEGDRELMGKRRYRAWCWGCDLLRSAFYVLKFITIFVVSAP